MFLRKWRRWKLFIADFVKKAWAISVWNFIQTRQTNVRFWINWEIPGATEPLALKPHGRLKQIG